MLRNNVREDKRVLGILGRPANSRWRESRHCHALATVEVRIAPSCSHSGGLQRLCLFSMLGEARVRAAVRWIDSSCCDRSCTSEVERYGATNA
jgi:hypothetical protein